MRERKLKERKKGRKEERKKGRKEERKKAADKSISTVSILLNYFLRKRSTFVSIKTQNYGNFSVEF
jgi:hypothetical protein